MNRKTRLLLALAGMVAVLSCELFVVERSFAPTSSFILAFAAISALGFWAMSFHRS